MEVISKRDIMIREVQEMKIPFPEAPTSNKAGIAADDKGKHFTLSMSTRSCSAASFNTPHQTRMHTPLQAKTQSTNPGSVIPRRACRAAFFETTYPLSRPWSHCLSRSGVGAIHTGMQPPLRAPPAFLPRTHNQPTRTGTSGDKGLYPLIQNSKVKSLPTEAL